MSGRISRFVRRGQMILDEIFLPAKGGGGRGTMPLPACDF